MDLGCAPVDSERAGHHEDDGRRVDRDACVQRTAGARSRAARDGGVLVRRGVRRLRRVRSGSWIPRSCRTTFCCSSPSSSFRSRECPRARLRSRGTVTDDWPPLVTGRGAGADRAPGRPRPDRRGVSPTPGTAATASSCRLARGAMDSLYVPKSYERHRPAPLVISMPGAGLSGAAQEAISRWGRAGRSRRLHRRLSDGREGRRPPDLSRRTDAASCEAKDVRFISDVIDALGSTYNIDPARIYANGLSNGGGMAFALSCTMPDRIAAVGAWCRPRRRCRGAGAPTRGLCR